MNQTKIEKIRIPNDPELWEHIEIEIQCGYYNTMTLREIIDNYINLFYVKGSIDRVSDALESTLSTIKEIKKNEQETKIQDR